MRFEDASFRQMITEKPFPYRNFMAVLEAEAPKVKDTYKCTLLLHHKYAY